jgi:hypothetical protein
MRRLQYCKGERPARAYALSLLRQGVPGCDWTCGRSGPRFRCASFGVHSLTGMGLHPPFVFGHFSEPSSSLYSVGYPGSDIQPWGPMNHRRCSHRLQFHQRTVGSTGRGRDQTRNGEYAALTVQTLIQIEADRSRPLVTVSGRRLVLECRSCVGSFSQFPCRTIRYNLWRPGQPSRHTKQKLVT